MSNQGATDIVAQRSFTSRREAQGEVAPASRIEPPRAERMKHGSALALWTLGVAFVLTLDDPRLRFPSFLVGLALSTAAWLWIARRAGDEGYEVSRPVLLLGIALAIGARLWCIFTPPALSEDVFRHIYEGRVVWWKGAGFPFLHPPARAEDFGVPPALLDASWLRVNHADIPTIYPPFAQLCFVLAGGLGELFGGGHLAILKSIFVFAELGAIACVAKAAGPGARQAAAMMLFSPLALFELAREGHADSLSMLGLALGVLGFTSLRPRLGYAGFALAALAKLNGIVALAAALRSTRRGAGGLLLLGLLALPLAFAGAGALTALTRYATEWRAGDGIFTPILALAELALGGDWRRFGELTITRHQLARALDFVFYVSFAAWILRRRAGEARIPEAAGLLLLALLLFSPTLHPWYALWVLPFAAVADRGRAAMIALLALVPLLHHASFLELTTGTWTDLAWVRALVHVPVWLLLFRDLARSRAPG